MSAARRARLPRVARIALVALGAVLALVGPLAVPASAHADVVGFTPGPAEVLEKSPKKVEVWFSEGVDVRLGGMFVYDSNGERVPAGKLRQPTPDRLVLPLTEDLPDGSYIVTWRAVSEDTHPIQGTWTFHVGSQSASTPDVDALAEGLLAGQRADRAVAIGWGIARWVVFATMALLVGGVVFGSVIWGRARDARATRLVVTAGWVGLTAATAVGCLLFGVYSGGGTLADVFDVDTVRDTLDTRFGRVWLLRLVALVAGFVVVRVLFERRPAATRRLPEWWLPVAAILGVVIVSTPGLAGHASGGDHQTLALALSTVHVAAMSVWLGGLVVLVTAVLPRDDLDELGTASRRFSRVATGCVIALIVTGAVQTWRVVGGLDALRDSEYGRILVVKLVVFALLLVVATFSREITNRLLPRPPAPRPVGDADREVPVVAGAAIEVGERPPPPADDEDQVDVADERRRLRRAVWLEVVLGALVLVVTALLVNATPPTDAARVREGATGVTVRHEQVTLDVTAVPGQAGLNDLHVNTYSPEGAPLTVDAVEMTLALPERDIAPLEVPLRQLGPGHYLSPGLDIPLAGKWRLQAVVRLGPVDRVDLTGDLEIG